MWCNGLKSPFYFAGNCKFDSNAAKFGFEAFVLSIIDLERSFCLYLKYHVWPLFVAIPYVIVILYRGEVLFHYTTGGPISLDFLFFILFFRSVTRRNKLHRRTQTWHCSVVPYDIVFDRQKANLHFILYI